MISLSIIIVLLIGFIFYQINIWEKSKTKKLILGVLSLSVWFFLLISLVGYTSGNGWGGELGMWLSGKSVKNFGILFYLSLLLYLNIISIFLISGKFLKKDFVFLTNILLIILILNLFILPHKFGGILTRNFQNLVERYFGKFGKFILGITFLGIFAYLSLLKFNFKEKKRKKEKKEIKRSLEEIEEKIERKKEQESKKAKESIRKEPEEDEWAEFNPKELYQLLEKPEKSESLKGKFLKEIEETKKKIEEKFEEFKIYGKVKGYKIGPVLTLYEFEPAPGIKLSKITSLADDIALRIKMPSVRIVAPLGNTGLVGIEIPNKVRKIVKLRELIETDEFFSDNNPIKFALGVNTMGIPYYADLSSMPHLLIAGATGSGKSVCIHSIITSIILKATPNSVRFLLIDPKRIELSLYEGIPHLVYPVIKEREQSAKVLKRAVKWMEERYKLFAREGAKDLESYNKKNPDKKLPFIVIIIDEFGDLILTLGKEIENPLVRLAQMARAVGIHLIIATQRPSVDIVTGLIKANFPVRIAFYLPSKHDSRTILDMQGAEKLLGKGDMLFIPPTSSQPIRLQGPLTTEKEVKAITNEYIKFHLQKLIYKFFNKKLSDKILNKVIEEEWYISLCRDEKEPGIKEKFMKLIGFISKDFNLPFEFVRNRLEDLKKEYYPNLIDEEILKEIEGEEYKEFEEEIESSQLSDEWDPLLKEVIQFAVNKKKLSATLLQRQFKIGFARAARIIDQLEQLGIVSPPEGNKPRKVLIKPEEVDLIIKKIK